VLELIMLPVVPVSEHSTEIAADTGLAMLPVQAADALNEANANIGKAANTARCNL
jgi:hypothetical protein